jgi:hypothetical protein
LYFNFILDSFKAYLLPKRDKESERGTSHKWVNDLLEDKTAILSFFNIAKTVFLKL